MRAPRKLPGFGFLFLWCLEGPIWVLSRPGPEGALDGSFSVVGADYQLFWDLRLVPGALVLLQNLSCEQGMVEVRSGEWLDGGLGWALCLGLDLTGLCSHPARRDRGQHRVAPSAVLPGVVNLWGLASVRAEGKVIGRSRTLRCHQDGVWDVLGPLLSQSCMACHFESSMAVVPDVPHS